MTALPVMTELGRGLGWRGKILAMLWIHLDESGEHDSGSGHLKRLAIAGGIAPFESWEILSLEWSAILEAFYIPMFHMADFESREATPFKGWSEEKRRLLLSGLLDVAVRHIPFFFGTV